MKESANTCSITEQGHSPTGQPSTVITLKAFDLAAYDKANTFGSTVFTDENGGIGLPFL